MNEFFKDMGDETKGWIATVWSVCSVFMVLIICVCVNCTATEINNPNPHKWDRKTEPTVKARLVSIEDK